MSSVYKSVTAHGKAIISKTAGHRNGPFNKNLKSTRTNSAGAGMAETLARKGKTKGPDKGTG